MKKIILILALTLSLINVVIGEEHDLLWKYKIDGDVKSVEITQNGEYIVVRGSDRKIYLFNREGELLWSYKIDGYIKSMAITPNGEYIVAGSDDKNVYLLNREGELLWKYNTNGYVKSVAITPNGEYIVAGSEFWDKKVYLFNREGELLWKNKTGGNVNSVAITPNGEYIVAGSDDKNVYLFNPLKAVSKEVIKNVKSTILEVKSKYDVTEAGSTLLLAEEAFNEGNYSKAKELALKAKSLALDIDQDGIPNEEDFAPYIKNEYIYIGIGVLILLIIVGISIILLQKKKESGQE